MSKSRFDKGSTIGNGRWDEEEHPRDEKGRFASDGGSSGSGAFKGEELRKVDFRYQDSEVVVSKGYNDDTDEYDHFEVVGSDSRTYGPVTFYSTKDKGDAQRWLKSKGFSERKVDLKKVRVPKIHGIDHPTKDALRVRRLTASRKSKF